MKLEIAGLRLGILGLALVLRLGHLAAVAHAPFVAQLAMDSLEFDRWALRIAAGDWLPSEPFFQPPLYPYLLAVLYRGLGHHLVGVYLVQIGCALAGIYALERAGRSLGGRAEGLVAAAGAAVYAPFVFYDVQLLKESLAVTTVCFLLWFLLAGCAAGKTASWAAAGVASGVLALLRENMLLVFPVLLLLPLCSRAEPSRRLRNTAFFALAFALVLLPSAVHNARTGGGFLPTTFQGGVNFYIGNHPGADGGYQSIVPGKQVPYYERREPVRIAEQEQGRRLSAAEVSRHWLDKSLSWTQQEPGAFSKLQLRKLGMFWSWYERPDAVDYYYFRQLSPVLSLPLLEFGGVCLLALAGLFLARRRLATFAPVLLFALLWMASTVAFFLFARYRLPIVPALLLLAAVPLAELARSIVHRAEPGARRRAFVLAAIVLTAWLAPRAAGFEPRWDLLHYNLGKLADNAGESEQAAVHYHAAVEANPRDFLSCLNLGNHAVRARRWDEARSWFERAAAIEPGFDDAWINLAGVELAAGNLGAAERALDKALALNPQSANALQNRVVLALQQKDLVAARAYLDRLRAVDPQGAALKRLELRAREAEKMLLEQREPVALSPR